MKAAAAYIGQADEDTQKELGTLMPHMLEVSNGFHAKPASISPIADSRPLCAST